MPDRVSIWIHAYRGDRNETLSNRCNGIATPEPTFEDMLLYAGHVGVSFGDEPEVYGFLPDARTIAPVELLRRLKEGDAFPGVVDDHQHVFEYATRHGCNVMQLEYLYPRERATRVKASILHERSAMCRMYSFPDGVGDCNCATWLREMGLEIPEQSGQMFHFMRAMTVLLPSAPVAIDDSAE